MVQQVVEVRQEGWMDRWMRTYVTDQRQQRGRGTDRGTMRDSVERGRDGWRWSYMDAA